MPGGDRTGPRGAGPMTGRAAGFCAGSHMPGYVHPVGGRGNVGRGPVGGRGRGGGFGRRNQYYATGLPGWARGSYGYPVSAAAPTAEEELAGLKQEAEHVQNTLNGINSRIQQLEEDGNNTG